MSGRKSLERNELVFNYDPDSKQQATGDQADLEIILLGPSHSMRKRTSTNDTKSNKSIVSMDEFDPLAPARDDNSNQNRTDEETSMGSKGSDNSNGQNQSSDRGLSTKKEVDSRKDDRILRRLERRYKRNKNPGDEGLSVDYLDYF